MAEILKLPVERWRNICKVAGDSNIRRQTRYASLQEVLDAAPTLSFYGRNLQEMLLESAEADVPIDMLTHTDAEFLLDPIAQHILSALDMYGTEYGNACSNGDTAMAHLSTEKKREIYLSRLETMGISLEDRANRRISLCEFLQIELTHNVDSRHHSSIASPLREQQRP